MSNEILKLKIDLVKMGWQIEERTGTDGWGLDTQSGFPVRIGAVKMSIL